MNKVASVRSVVTPTVQELVARAGELAPLLRKNGPIGETNRRVVDESMEAVAKAGLMKICTPKRYGGWEMNTRAMLDVSAAVAAATSCPPNSRLVSHSVRQSTSAGSGAAAASAPATSTGASTVFQPDARRAR